MDFKDIKISPELRAKAKACKSPEELLALAKNEGYKLSDADMEAVAGGGMGWTYSSDGSDFEGDSRGYINPECVPADFVNGLIDGGELN